MNRKNAQKLKIFSAILKDSSQFQTPDKNKNSSFEHQNLSTTFQIGFSEKYNLSSIYINTKQTMKENRKCWTEEEDQAIKSFVRRYGMKRWTLISEKMKERFPEQGRSGKQCRERWHNHLSPLINKEPWLEDELKIVFNAHQRLGNKWTEIAQLLEGRTDNSVKNQFYSTLRKGLRRMSKVLGTRNSTTKIKKIKPSTLSALISNLNSQDMESEIYNLLFIFSSTEKYEEMKDKTVSEAEKEKIQFLLLKLLSSEGNHEQLGASARKRLKNSISNSQISMSSELMDDEEEEDRSDEIQQQNQIIECEASQMKEDAIKDCANLDFHFQIEDDFIFPEQEDLFGLKIHKKLSLKKESSINQEKSDSLESPENLHKKSSSNERLNLNKKPSIAEEYENIDGFLSVSPRASKGNSNFWSRTPKMPTPHTWDAPSQLFTTPATQEQINFDKFTDQLKQKIAENTSKKML